MQTQATRIIDALGGTSAVSRLTETPPSTVHSWRKNGIPRSRFAHLRLVGQQLTPPIDVDAFVGGEPAENVA
ncbi:carph-isopro domain-containing protein [Sphingomonas corticis]|uniref:carph-isopro domain-containing protein n=1 Tax=Sphingomonas corticis TaxID=2722791 RepID=UPI003B82FDBD